MLEQSILLKDEDGLRAGDTIHIFVRPSGPTIMRAAQLDAVEQRLAKDPRFQWRRMIYPQYDGDGYTYIVTVVDPNAHQKQLAGGIVITARVIGAIVAAVLIVPATIYVYKLVKAGAEGVVEGVQEAASSVTSMATSVAVAVGAFYVIRWLRA